jgi:hypothetical protein
MAMPPAAQMPATTPLRRREVFENSTPKARMRAAAPTNRAGPMSRGSASMTREKPKISTTSTTAPAIGSSRGCMIRLRTPALTCGSPVARSDQATTIHSAVTTMTATIPAMNQRGSVMTPMTRSTPASAPTNGHMLAATGSAAAGDVRTCTSSMAETLASRAYSVKAPRPARASRRDISPTEPSAPKFCVAP